MFKIIIIIKCSDFMTCLFIFELANVTVRETEPMRNEQLNQQFRRKGSRDDGQSDSRVEISINIRAKLIFIL